MAQGYVEKSESKTIYMATKILGQPGCSAIDSARDCKKEELKIKEPLSISNNTKVLLILTIK